MPLVEDLDIVLPNDDEGMDKARESLERNSLSTKSLTSFLSLLPSTATIALFSRVVISGSTPESLVNFFNALSSESIALSSL